MPIKSSPISYIFLFQVALEQHYREKANGIFAHLAVPGKQVTDTDLRSLMFGDYMAGKDTERNYDEVTDFSKLQTVR